jgi:hypothetical protein
MVHANLAFWRPWLLPMESKNQTDELSCLHLTRIRFIATKRNAKHLYKRPYESIRLLLLLLWSYTSLK